MQKRDKGVTLIELIITLSLLSILLSFSLLSINSLKNYENNIDIDYCNNSILGLIDNSKLYCKKENSSGYIQFDLVSNEITFYCYSKQGQKAQQAQKIEKYILPRKFTIYNINSEYNRIRISINGMIIDGTGIDGMTTNSVTTDSCTITFKDSRNSLHKITIRVGTNYVEVKE
jgi:prepilin-type N-terminal cleavage/methylation domain-containing protein